MHTGQRPTQPTCDCVTGVVTAVVILSSISSETDVTLSQETPSATEHWMSSYAITRRCSLSLLGRPLLLLAHGLGTLLPGVRVIGWGVQPWGSNHTGVCYQGNSEEAWPSFKKDSFPRSETWWGVSSASPKPLAGSGRLPVYDHRPVLSPLPSARGK